MTLNPIYIVKDNFISCILVNKIIVGLKFVDFTSLATEKSYCSTPYLVVTELLATPKTSSCNSRIGTHNLSRLD